MTLPDEAEPLTGALSAHVTDADLAYPLNADSPHVADALAAGAPARFYLVDVSGLAPERIAALIPTMVRVVKADGMIPVFVTDLCDFAVFRASAVIFEAVPPVAASAALAPDLDWQVRRDEYLALVEEKWQPAGRTTLGPAEEPGAP